MIGLIDPPLGTRVPLGTRAPESPIPLLKGTSIPSRIPIKPRPEDAEDEHVLRSVCEDAGCSRPVDHALRDDGDMTPWTKRGNRNPPFVDVTIFTLRLRTRQSVFAQIK